MFLAHLEALCRPHTPPADPLPTSVPCSPPPLHPATKSPPSTLVHGLTVPTSHALMVSLWVTVPDQSAHLSLPDSTVLAALSGRTTPRVTTSSLFSASVPRDQSTKLSAPECSICAIPLVATCDCPTWNSPSPDACCSPHTFPQFPVGSCFRVHLFALLEMSFLPNGFPCKGPACILFVPLPKLLTRSNAMALCDPQHLCLAFGTCRAGWCHRS